LGVALLLIAAPAAASPVSPIAGDLLSPVIDLVDPVVEELEPVVDPVVEELEPVVDLVDPVLDPVVDLVDPALDPVEEVVDPVLDPVDEIVDPVEEIVDPVEEIVDPVEEDPGSVDPEGATPVEGTPRPRPGSEPSPIPIGSQPPVQVSSQGVGDPAAIGGPAGAAALLPSTRPEVVLSPLVTGSLLAEILDWVRRIDAGSILAAPFLALRVLLRALLSAGKGLLAPAVLLAGFAFLMARDRRHSGTKSP
jgi:hypothetical protein